MGYLLHHLLSEAAERDPDHVAVRCRDRSLTYGELESAANGVATTLVAAGVQRHDRVGIHLPKSVEMVAAVYGVLKAGAVYVPLDPRAPKARLGAIATDCQLAALISTHAGATSLLSAVDGSDLRLAILVGDEDAAERSDRPRDRIRGRGGRFRASRASPRSMRISRTSSTRRARPGRRRA